MHQVYHFFKEEMIKQPRLYSVLDAAVEVDGKDTLRTGRHTSGTQRITESIVLNFIAQAAAAAQRIGIVAHIGKERMAFGIHLRREVTVFLIQYITVFRQQCHSLYRESKHSFSALLIEPFHETFLQPAQGIPIGLTAIGKHEMLEKTVEVILVIVCHIPENGLEISCAGRLVDGVDHLLEAVRDYLVYGPLSRGKVHYLFGMQIVVLAIFFTNKVVHVHQKFRCGTSATQHARYNKHHIDKTTAERFQISGCRRVTSHRHGTSYQPGIHGDTGAIVGKTGFIVFIDKVVIQQLQITVGYLLAIHIFEAVRQQTTIQADEVRFGKLAYQSSHILIFHIGIGIILTAGGRIGSITIVQQETEFVAHLAVLQMLLPVKHKRLCHGIVVLGHQSHLYLILYIFHTGSVADAHTAENIGDDILGSKTAH